MADMVARCLDIVVAGPQPLVLCGLIAVLRTARNLEVVASCRDSKTCVQTIRALLPNLAVVDCALPDQGALHVLTVVRSEKLGTRVIVLSGSDDPSSTADLVRNGADRVLSREISPDALLRCLQDVHCGRRSPLVSKSVNRQHPGARGPAGDPSSVLTERERQIMHLVCEGLSNKEIGRQFKVSDGTVKIHLHHIYEKLAIHNRTTLAALAAGKSRRLDSWLEEPDGVHVARRPA